MKRQVVLVTGASGFIGRNLTEFLLEKGYRIIALDREKGRFCHPQYQYVYGFAEDGKEWELREISGDIRDLDLLQRVFGYQIDYVIHLAALSTIQMGARDKQETRSVNVDGTRNLLNAVKEREGIKGFLFASTDKVYGKLTSQAYTEKDQLLPLDSPYDRSKREADEMVCRFWETYGVHTVTLRFCNIYGRYDRHTTRIIPGTIQAILNKRECVLRVYRADDGRLQNYRRDFLYVDDLCEAIGRILERLEIWNQRNDALWGQAFNLGSCRNDSVCEVMQLLRMQMECRTPLRVEVSEGLPEIPRQHMDFTKARQTFGFEPVTPLEKGLKETVTWWQSMMKT